MRATLDGMSKIINLRTHRKQSARADKRREADAQAARHGRSKATRASEAAQADKARAHLDGHQIADRVTPDQSTRPTLSRPNGPDGDAPDPAP